MCVCDCEKVVWETHTNHETSGKLQTYLLGASHLFVEDRINYSTKLRHTARHTLPTGFSHVVLWLYYFYSQFTCISHCLSTLLRLVRLLFPTHRISGEITHSRITNSYFSLCCLFLPNIDRTTVIQFPPFSVLSRSVPSLSLSLSPPTPLQFRLL